MVEKGAGIVIANAESAPINSFVALVPTPLTPLLAVIKEVLRVDSRIVIMAVPVEVSTGPRAQLVPPYHMPRVTLPAEDATAIRRELNRTSRSL